MIRLLRCTSVLALGMIASSAFAQSLPPNYPRTTAERFERCLNATGERQRQEPQPQYCDIITEGRWTALPATAEEAVFHAALLYHFSDQRQMIRRIRKGADLDRSEAAALATQAKAAQDRWFNEIAPAINEETVCSRADSIRTSEELERSLKEASRRMEEARTPLVKRMLEQLNEETASKLVRYAMEEYPIHYIMEAADGLYADETPIGIRGVINRYCSGTALLLPRIL